MKLPILALFITLSSATTTAPVPAELGNNPGAIAEYNRIIGLAEAARASKGNETDLLDKRGCGLDPCCPDGSLTCVDDFCSFGDGLNFFGCLLGCCVACNDHTRYCNGKKPT